METREGEEESYDPSERTTRGRIRFPLNFAFKSLAG